MPCARRDVYLLLTQQSGLLPSPQRISAPAAYDPSPTVKLDHEVTIDDGADFFFDCASLLPPPRPDPFILRSR